MEAVLISSLLALDLYSIYLYLSHRMSDQTIFVALIIMLLFDMFLLVVRIRGLSTVKLCTNIAIHVFGGLYPLVRSMITMTLITKISFDALILLIAFSISSALTLSGVKKQAIYLNVLRYATIVAMATTLAVNGEFVWYLASSVATIGVVVMDLMYYILCINEERRNALFVIGGAGYRDSIILSHVYAASIALACYIVRQIVQI